MYLAKVVSASVENEKIKQVQCIKTEVKENRVIDIENSEFNINADTIIFAIGLTPNINMLQENGIMTENNLVKVDKNYKTNIEDVFAGGDLVETKSTVCRAIATGKKVANAIIEEIIN